jgi:hypothetical protein
VAAPVAGATVIRGVNLTSVFGTQPAMIQQELASAKTANARWIRIGISWNALEASRKRSYEKPGMNENAFLLDIDKQIDGARARGMHVLAFVDSTPAWATADGTRGQGKPPSPEHYDDYAAFVGRLAKRWTTNVAAWQIWNEPNLDHFWKGTDAAAYAKLVSVAAPAIKAQNPRAIIVTAGLSPTGVDPYAFVARMFSAGIGPHADRLGLNSYPYDTPERCERRADKLPETYELCSLSVLVKVARQNDPTIQGWVTELGWSTLKDWRYPNQASPTEQAAYLKRADKVLTRRGGVQKAFWYALRDTGTDKTSWHENLGLLSSSFTRKPALAAFRKMNVRPKPRTVPAAPAPAPAPAPTPPPAP